MKIAVLSNELKSPASSFRILPAGTFRAIDGRPTDTAGWVLTAERAASLVSQASIRANDYVIDYEHATLGRAKDGQEAPAAGWFKSLRFVPGDGLYAEGVQWTARAAAFISAREYRYASPVFHYDRSTGEVLALHSVAITNDPGLGGLTDLAALSSLSCPAGARSHVAVLTNEEVKGIQSFNGAFGRLGVLHPDTDRMCAQASLQLDPYLSSVGFSSKR